MTAAHDPILVIKLGAFGDFIQAIGPMAAIRRHHPGQPIVLLTTAPYVGLSRLIGAADEIWTDQRPGPVDLAGWLALRQLLRARNFRRVYDLQTSDRSGWYFRLFWPGPYPEWSGVAAGASHPHANPMRDAMHTVERQRDQLAFAGVADVPLTDLAGLARQADVAKWKLTEPYALLVPGGAAHRPAKRWPVQYFAELARILSQRAIVPIVVGTAAERSLAETIRAACPDARDVTGMTSVTDLLALAGRAVAAIGNDTGPLHLAAAAGCAVTVLFSHASNPALCAPRGRAVAILRRDKLADLAVDAVAATLPDHSAKSVN
ncbi:MAG: glycosyltransferase family 9 protein [Alphaproteobacteria bacterium]|nr:glycosyltransferase family 9 protein [Alphaproteobacteria bacterium]